MEDKKLQEIINRILKVITPEKIILFGSRATGQAKAESDYDLMVISSDNDKAWRIEQQIYKNFIGLGVPVDVILTTPEKLDKHKNTIGYVYKEALKNGIIVYGH